MKAKCFQMCEKSYSMHYKVIEDFVSKLFDAICNRIVFPSITSIFTTPAFESHLDEVYYTLN